MLQIVEAIAYPAANVGVRFEPGSVRMSINRRMECALRISSVSSQVRVENPIVYASNIQFQLSDTIRAV